MAKRKKLTEKEEFEMACMERQARGRAGWGFYASYVRQTTLDEECEKLRRELAHLTEREKEERIREFQRSRSNGGMYIG